MHITVRNMLLQTFGSWHVYELVYSEDMGTNTRSGTLSGIFNVFPELPLNRSPMSVPVMAYEGAVERRCVVQGAAIFYDMILQPSLHSFDGNTPLPHSTKRCSFGRQTPDSKRLCAHSSPARNGAGNQLRSTITNSLTPRPPGTPHSRGSSRLFPRWRILASLARPTVRDIFLPMSGLILAGNP